MNDDVIAVTGGVDCHQRSHHAAALDQAGRLLADAAFPATQRGYEALLVWLQTFGTITAVGGGIHRRLRRGTDPVPARCGRHRGRGQPAAPAHA